MRLRRRRRSDHRADSRSANRISLAQENRGEKKQKRSGLIISVRLSVVPSAEGKHLIVKQKKKNNHPHRSLYFTLSGIYLRICILHKSVKIFFVSNEKTPIKQDLPCCVNIALDDGG